MLLRTTKLSLHFRHVTFIYWIHFVLFQSFFSSQRKELMMRQESETKHYERSSLNFWSSMAFSYPTVAIMVILSYWVSSWRESRNWGARIINHPVEKLESSLDFWCDESDCGFVNQQVKKRRSRRIPQLNRTFAKLNLDVLLVNIKKLNFDQLEFLWKYANTVRVLKC